ncbi:MAG TPA: DUF2167 domain-containing protein [Polyangia bacterium]|nr:DUF2167 domain-containing protein [Polyangia bacterium]
MMRLRWVGLFVALGLLVGGRARAGKETAADPSTESPAADGAKSDAAKTHPKLGPQKIDLGDDLVIDLPEGMAYIDRVEAKRLMEKMGNRTDASLRGLVFGRDKSWVMVFEYVGDGYVKDDDAADLKPDEILQSIKEGTEQENEFRKEKGIPLIHADGWTEPPRYDRAVHHLIWGIRGKDDDGKISSINFYTRVLGRHGYVALNLMDDPKTIEASKVDGLALLRATTFKPGARYEDFDKSHDKVAEYGLAALVLGGAGAAALKLAKVGLLAKFGGKLIAILIAAKKLVVVFFVGVGAWLKRVFGGKRASESLAAPPPTAVPFDPPPPMAPPPAGPPPSTGPPPGSQPPPGAR